MHRFRRWTDEDDPLPGAGIGKAGVLAQEPISGVNGLSAAFSGYSQDPAGIQIGFGGRVARQRVGFVGRTRPERTRVRIRVHGHSAHAQFMAGANDPQGNLPAVGDQDLLKRGTGHGEIIGRGRESGKL